MYHIRDIMNEKLPLSLALDNLPVWTVSDLSQALKRTVEDAFPLVRL